MANDADLVVLEGMVSAFTSLHIFLFEGHLPIAFYLLCVIRREEESKPTYMHKWNVTRSKLEWWAVLCPLWLCSICWRISSLAADYDSTQCSPLMFQVKHPEVAQFLGGRLYDCVFKFNEAWKTLKLLYDMGHMALVSLVGYGCDTTFNRSHLQWYQVKENYNLLVIVATENNFFGRCVKTPPSAIQANNKSKLSCMLFI